MVLQGAPPTWQVPHCMPDRLPGSAETHTPCNICRPGPLPSAILGLTITPPAPSPRQPPITCCIFCTSVPSSPMRWLRSLVISSDSSATPSFPCSSPTWARRPATSYRPAANPAGLVGHSRTVLDRQQCVIDCTRCLVRCWGCMRALLLWSHARMGCAGHCLAWPASTAHQPTSAATPT
jgi:hypothetical protein